MGQEVDVIMLNAKEKPRLKQKEKITDMEEKDDPK